MYAYDCIGAGARQNIGERTFRGKPTLQKAAMADVSVNSPFITNNSRLAV